MHRTPVRLACALAAAAGTALLIAPAVGAPVLPAGDRATEVIAAPTLKTTLKSTPTAPVGRKL